MESAEGKIKRKSRLAVFEHVVEKEKNSKHKKFRTNRLDLGDSSPSESELVIDDKPVKKKKNLLIRLTEEPLHLLCEWGLCEESFKTWKHFNTHLMNHAVPELANLKCQWRGCKIESATVALLMQHLSFHGYLSKLKNIGQNVLSRNNLPQCTRKERYTEPIHPEGYTCDWEYCGLNFYTIHDFYTHMEIHIKNNPRVSKESLGEIIQCCWTGCSTKFSSQYKLAEHVRTHTKEKTVACPTCCALFSNKTKFCDHRKLQLSTHLQSYQCSQCLKLFPSERILRDHMRSHINHYKCTMCDMTCPKPSILAKHIRFKHVKDKPYKCTECTKTFVTKHNLLTHIKSHLDASMTCDQCDFKCRTKGALDNHNAKVHEKIRLSGSYECHCCKQRFRRGGYLTKHLMRVHNYHWPSGHSRFRYRKDQDNIHRLQTVRYESLEVTQEMIRSETMQTNNVMESVSYNLRYDDGQSEYVLSVSENGEQSVKATSPKQNNIIITINDVDEHGNILKSQVVESKEFIGVVKSGDVFISEQSSPNVTEVEGVINELDSIKSESANVIDIKDEPLRA